MIDDFIIPSDYIKLKRPVRISGNTGAVMVSSALEEKDVYVILKTKAKNAKGSGSKIYLPRSLIGQEVLIIIPKDDKSYNSVYID